MTAAVDVARAVSPVPHRRGRRGRAAGPHACAWSTGERAGPARPERVGQEHAAAAAGRRSRRPRRGSRGCSAPIARRAGGARRRAAFRAHRARPRRPALRPRAAARPALRADRRAGAGAAGRARRSSAAGARTSCWSGSASASWRGARPGELSGGEQQRVAVCAAVAHRPPLLLADEPGGELDAANAHAVYDLIAELAREGGTTVLMVSHDPATGRNRRSQRADPRRPPQRRDAARGQRPRSWSAAAAGCGCRRSCCAAPASASGPAPRAAKAVSCCARWAAWSSRPPLQPADGAVAPATAADAAAVARLVDVRKGYGRGTAAARCWTGSATTSRPAGCRP